jgi:cytidyltransferase-like protein
MEGISMITGYAYVCGDIIHIGHILHLNNCKALCDVLFVGVLSERAVMEKKSKPLLSLAERMYAIANLKAVDCAVCQDEYSPLENCKSIRPDILFESSSHSEMPANNFIKSIGGRVIAMPYFSEQSSTNLKKGLKNAKTDNNVGNTANNG